MTQEELHRSVRKFVKNFYPKEKIMITKDFILCEGDIPIMLTAHMDTVFSAPPTDIYHDPVQHVIWSPQGLGADDRAGVFAILKILNEGYKPHILFTTDEEIGGVGASVAARIMPQCLLDLKYIIELDRQGDYDCVFYSCANAKFREFIEGYGFVTNDGSFSDISIICPQWKVAGVNLSVGYKNEHQKIETLHTIGLHSTIKAVMKMLDEANEADYFEYIPDPDEYHFWSRYGCYAWGYPTDEDDYFDYPSIDRDEKKKCMCIKCNKTFNISDVFEVEGKENKNSIHYYCIDCIATDADIQWCAKCGRPFEPRNNGNNQFCYECGEDNREPIYVML